MPRWTITADYAGRDVFIIGGGDSLRHGFDWSLLKDERTIGCNSAFTLGAEICKICIFGDAKWFKTYAQELSEYEGLVFTSHAAYKRAPVDWLWYLPRKSKGLGTDSLGWNNNTGSQAINLALILGASRVYLLGFDMHLSKDGRPNWHDNQIDKPDRLLYKKFIKHFSRVKKALPEVFPGTEIINITDDSSLDMFPKIGVKEFWKERRNHVA